MWGSDIPDMCILSNLPQWVWFILLSLIITCCAHKNHFVVLIEMHFSRSHLLSLSKTCLKLLTNISLDSEASSLKTTIGQTLFFRVSPGPCPANSPPHLEGRPLVMFPAAYEDGVEFSVEGTKRRKPLFFNTASCYPLCLSCNPDCCLFGGWGGALHPFP